MRAIDICSRAFDQTNSVTPTVLQTGPTSDLCVCNIEYSVASHQSHQQRGSLIDRGANGGIIGNDAHVYLKHQRQVDVTGIDNHELSSLIIVDASARVMTQRGPAIVIMHQYAYHGLNRTIHSSVQIEHYRNTVDDRPLRLGGTQCLRTHDGYVMAFDFSNGLPFLPMEPHTREEWNTLPHIILTSGDVWDPSVVDETLTDKDDWYNTVKDLDDGRIQTPFDEFGNYRHRHQAAPSIPLPDLDDPDHETASLCEITDFRTCFHMLSNLNTV